MSERRPFHRKQPRTWWAQSPYVAYTVRELSGVAVALYGAILLAGLVCLARGPDAFARYRQIVASEASLLIHLLLFVAVVWHVVTWFQTMPKTIPKLILHGRPVPQARLTAASLVFAAVCSVALLAVVVVVGACS
jgi:fumarate reductase subunit C